jgi:hypothetical protein
MTSEAKSKNSSRSWPKPKRQQLRTIRTSPKGRRKTNIPAEAVLVAKKPEAAVFAVTRKKRVGMSLGGVAAAAAVTVCVAVAAAAVPTAMSVARRGVTAETVAGSVTRAILVPEVTVARVQVRIAQSYAYPTCLDSASRGTLAQNDIQIKSKRGKRGHPCKISLAGGGTSASDRTAFSPIRQMVRKVAGMVPQNPAALAVVARELKEKEKISCVATVSIVSGLTATIAIPK